MTNSPVVDVLASEVSPSAWHAVSLLTSGWLASHGPLRKVGALGTYLVGVALGVTVLVTI